MRTGTVLFANDPQRVARFYATLAGMTTQHASPGYVVLTLGEFELVLHALPPHVVASNPIPDPPLPREDSWSKLVFHVPSLAAARAAAGALGGALKSPEHEWSEPARAFRACDGNDPEGNIVQFREALD